MDADDYLIPKGMKILKEEYFDTYGQADMIGFEYHIVDNNYNSEKWEWIHRHNLLYHGSFLDTGNKFGLGWNACFCVISRKLIKEHNIRFKPYVRAEDTLFMFSLFSITDAIAMITNLNIYRYCKRNNSATTSLDKKYIEKALIGGVNIVEELKRMRSVSLYRKELFDDIIIYLQGELFVKACHSTFSYIEIKSMLHYASEKNFYPIEKDVSRVSKFINKTYNKPFIVYIFSLVFRYVYIPYIKPLNIHNTIINKLSR